MREALAGLIEASGLRVACFSSAQEFLLRPMDEAPACLVLDVRLPGGGGFDLQRELAAAGREMPIIFITAHADMSMAVRAMKAGAFEFLPKPIRAEDLLTAVWQALEGDRRALVQRAELVRMRERRGRLTARECQVMESIGHGRLNKQIAAELGISENTVKAHRRHIMSKMGARSFAELVLMLERFP